MLPFLFIVILCSNFLFIKSEDDGNLTIEVPQNDICKTNFEGTHSAQAEFTEGQNVTLIIQPDHFIHYGWWNLINANGTQKMSDKLGSLSSIKKQPQQEQQQQQQGQQQQQQEHDKDKKPNPILYTRSLDNSMAGTWEFRFYYLKKFTNYRNLAPNLPRIQGDNHTDGASYTMSVCRITVKIEPATKSILPNASSQHQMLSIIASGVGAFLVAVIIAQAAYIFFLKNKARKLITLNTHNNLSKKSESISNDTARYCSSPGQKMMKAPILEEDNNRDSVIYEAPNVEIRGNNRIPMQPPQPPAITTIPRTPRQGRPDMLASNLLSRSPMPGTLPPNFHRPNHDPEVSIANRPPLPPPEGYPHNVMFQEEYEEVETEENTYEPPPVINTLPPRLMPQKKVPTGNLLDVKENTLKLRQGNKPPVTPKPLPHRSNIIPNQPMSSDEFEQALRRRNINNDIIPRANTGHLIQPQQQDPSFKRRPNGDAQSKELEEAFRRRNNSEAKPNELEEVLRRRNVKQVPIQSIPDPSSRSSPKPKPPPALTSKPPPVRHPVQEEIYYNEASSDEEWTYEPLKPLNGYDANIYNV